MATYSASTVDRATVGVSCLVFAASSNWSSSHHEDISQGRMLCIPASPIISINEGSGQDVRVTQVSQTVIKCVFNIPNNMHQQNSILLFDIWFYFRVFGTTLEYLVLLGATLRYLVELAFRNILVSKSCPNHRKCTQVAQVSTSKHKQKKKISSQ